MTELDNILKEKVIKTYANGNYKKKFVYKKPELRFSVFFHNPWLHINDDYYIKNNRVLSSVALYNANNQIIEEKLFQFKTCFGQVAKVLYEYFPNGDYEKKIISNFTSYIEHYDKEGRLLSINCYSDKKNRKLDRTITYQYNEDGSYTKNFVFEKKSLVKPYFSVIENYDKNNCLLSTKEFKDKKYENVYCTLIYKYNPDGSYTEEEIKEQEKDYYSLYCYNKNHDYLFFRTAKYTLLLMINILFKRKKEFNILNEEIIKHYENGDYLKKVVFKLEQKEPNITNYYDYYYPVSKHILYNAKGKIKEETHFKDTNCKKVIGTAKYEYKENNRYIVTYNFEKEVRGCLYSFVVISDENQKLLSEKKFSEANIQVEYNQDGSYTQKIVRNRKFIGKYYSSVEKYDKNNIKICAKHYTGKNFKNNLLDNIKEEEIIERYSNGDYIKKVIYKHSVQEPSTINIKNGDINYYNVNSSLIQYNSSNKIVKETHFKDKKGQDEVGEVTYEYNLENGYTKNYVYDSKSIWTHCTNSLTCDENNNLISFKRYFKYSNCNYLTEFNPNGSHTLKMVFENKQEDSSYSCIQKYDENDRIISEERYTDINFKNLYLTKTFEYDTDGKKTEKTFYNNKYA